MLGTPRGVDARDGKTKYGNDKSTLGASIGSDQAWYGVIIGNTGASRIYKGVLNRRSHHGGARDRPE